jgi:DNA-binding transcriptional LysR family regulator
MDFRRLEVFQQVFDLRSFSRAGQALLLAQPTISEHIRLLEEDLKLTLFDRQGREVIPTQAGALLYGYSRQLSALRRETLRAMQQFLDKGQGELLIGGSNIPGQYLLPGLLGKFKQKYPQVRVQVLIGDTRNIVEQVLAGAIEIGAVGARVEHRLIACQFLTKDELVGIQPADFPAAGLVKEIKIKKFPLLRNFYLIHRKQRTLSPLAEEFKEFLLREGNNDGLALNSLQMAGEGRPFPAEQKVVF